MIVHDDIDAAWLSLLAEVTMGVHTSPRGMDTFEVMCQSVAFDMRRPVLTIAARDLGYRFMPAEAAWILSGDNRLDTITQYSPFIWRFSDDGQFYSGAYGPRIVDQLTYVCDALLADAHTRQAVLTIWRSNPRTSRDIPCTLSMQFLARDGRLHVLQTMRSSDAWLGYPYDAFNAAMLAGYVLLLLRARVADAMRLSLGYHFFTAASAHIYEKEHALALSILEDDRRGKREYAFAYEPFDPLAFAKPWDLVEHLRALAREDWGALRADWLRELSAR